jgi:phenylpyruvate tautomerase
MGDAPELRMKLASQNLPKDCGIDPLTGQICGGDPSIILNTNVIMGEKKKAFLSSASKALASGLGKPESYVAVCVSDGQTMLFGGSEDPCALACCYSLGAINKENNKAVTAKISALLADFGIPSNRIYINFFDVPAANIGYGGATFAG